MVSKRLKRRILMQCVHYLMTDKPACEPELALLAPCLPPAVCQFYLSTVSIHISIYPSLFWQTDLSGLAFIQTLISSRDEGGCCHVALIFFFLSWCENGG